MELKKELKRKNEQESSMRKEIAQKNWIIKDEKSKLEKKTKELRLAQDSIEVIFSVLRTQMTLFISFYSLKSNRVCRMESKLWRMSSKAVEIQSENSKR